MREFDLRALQNCELDVLNEFIRVCNKYNLKYYAAWGTMLGAVRHQGFIPWDDDIDVCMPYDDYIRFKEVCKTELGAGYFYEDWHAHHDYFLHWAKIRKNNTTCMTRSEADLKIHWGVGIDIFPLIKLDKPRLGFDKKFAKVFLNLILQRAYYHHGAENISKKVKRVLYTMIPRIWDEKIINICFRIMSKAKIDAAYVYEFSEPISRACNLQEVYGEGKMYQFEDIMINGPEDSDAFLRTAYGDDYMIVPDEEKRIDHGDIIVDVNTNYTYYQIQEGFEDADFVFTES